MNDFINSITTFLIDNTTWLFMTVLLLAAMLYGFESTDLLHNWSAQFCMIISFSILFLPVIVFSLCRSWLTKNWSRNMIRLIWVYTFIIHPILISLGSFFFFDRLPFLPKIETSLQTEFIIGIGIALLLTELVIQYNDVLIKKMPSTNWAKKLSLEKVILGVMLLISFVAISASTYFESNYDSNSILLSKFYFIYFVAQYFLILLAYYFFYYVNHYLLINKVLKEKGIIYYFFGLLITIVLFYPIVAQLIAWLPVTQKLLVHPTAFESIFNSINILTPLFGMVVSIPFILIYQWFKQSSQIANLEKEQSEIELGLLKQQVNPHFFFNTLNNLYALSITNDKKTPEVILQLSELMRYVIYKGKENTVFLKEELKYIEDYIQLQQIRLHKNLDLQFKKNIDDEMLAIPPLLFIILVENAFKHGIENAESDCFLHIQLNSTAKEINFICENSIEDVNYSKTGIGLKNLKRRLALLFPDRHELQIQQTNHQYKVNLKIYID